MSWIPPKGAVLHRMALAICSNLSKVAPSSIEISSTINTFVLVQFITIFFFFLMLDMSCSAVPFPSPIPDQLLMVAPPKAEAANPVGAVTATAL
jgi:hypothetical protein